MCRPSNTVGPVICTTISPHGTTVLKRSLKPLLTVCACLCPIDTIQCDAFFFSRDGVLTLRVGLRVKFLLPGPVSELKSLITHPHS